MTPDQEEGAEGLIPESIGATAMEGQGEHPVGDENQINPKGVSQELISDHKIIINEAIDVNEDVKEGGDDSEEKSRPNSSMNRRAGIDHHFDINLALLKRVKKISIELPMVRQRSSRILKIVLKPTDYKHILDESLGGVYGTPSRPDLEMMVVTFGTSTSDLSNTPLKFLFCAGRTAFVLSRRIEDALLVSLVQHHPEVGILREAYIKAGEKKLNVLNTEKTRLWRKFINIYMLPLLTNEELIQQAIAKVKLFSGLSDAEAQEMENIQYGMLDGTGNGGGMSSDEGEDEDIQQKRTKNKKPTGKSHKISTNKR